MKYIKDYNSYNIDNIKKYVLSKEDNVYYLDEIVGIKKLEVEVEAINLYSYNEDTDELVEENRKSNFHFGYLKKVFYTSDSLKDCLDILEAQKNVKKFNI